MATRAAISGPPSCSTATRTDPAVRSGTRRPPRLQVRGLLSLAGLAAAAYVARRHVAMRTAMAAVPAELRSPLLPFITVRFTRRTLPIFRRMSRVTGRPGRDVMVTTRCVPGAHEVRVW